MNGKLVVVCIMDIGGDKEFFYFDFLKEMNLFLGFCVLCILIFEIGDVMFCI